ncbi:MAG: hypothetical protein EAZ07_05555 [Cytophagales bacterium]|nr:MAG: hypothetical protein EAZ07_05555 [Cytophagales bacterium]
MKLIIFRIILSFNICNCFISTSFGQRLVVDSLFLANTGTHELWDKTQIALYSFISTPKQSVYLPGKTIEVEEGDSVHIYSRSISNDGFHTIHLHGLDVDTENDGEPLTSFPIAPYNSYTYKFLAKNAGTYIYHCHVGDVMHVQMGMYGLVIVKAKGGKKTAWTDGPAYDKSFSWLSSEVDKFWHENTPNAMMNDFRIPVYSPNYFMINGKSQQQLNDTGTAIIAETNQKIYLRIANIGFYKHQFIFPSRLNPEVIDSDGRPLPKSYIADTLNVLPGERYGVMVSSSSSLFEKVKVNFIDMNNQVSKGIEEIPINVVNNVSIDKKSKYQSSIQIAPNPAQETIRISLNIPSKPPYMLRIKDLFGRTISEIYCQGVGIKEIDVASLPRAIYIIETNINGIIYSEKLILD